MSNWWAE